MDPIFNFDRYSLRRQVFALTGKFRVYDPNENLVLYSEQKMFRLREDIRVYADESKTREMLSIQARQIIDFSAAYDVIDSTTGQKIGALRRKGWSSMVRDEWEVLDINDMPQGVLIEDSLQRALLRRFLLGSLLPQDYDLFMGETRAADLKQRFDLFRYILDLDFSFDTAHRLDRRLGIVAGILLATVEGKQQS